MTKCKNQQLSEIISVYFYRQIWLIFQNIDIIYKTIPVIGGLWCHETVSILVSLEGWWEMITTVIRCLCKNLSSFAPTISHSIGMHFQIPIPNTTCESFKALLEYLYSDHAPIEEGDPVGIIVLANRFCQPRLVTLAEYYITKGIEKSFSTNDGSDADVDVIGILYSAKVYHCCPWKYHPCCPLFTIATWFRISFQTVIVFQMRHYWLRRMAKVMFSSLLVAWLVGRSVFLLATSRETCERIFIFF